MKNIERLKTKVEKAMDKNDLSICKYCEDRNCTLRSGVTDDPSCNGTINEMYECSYLDFYNSIKEVNNI